MSVSEMDRPNQADSEVQNLVQVALPQVTRLKDGERDLIYYYSSGASPAEIAQGLGLASPARAAMDLSTALGKIKFPADIPQERKRLVLRLALDLYDKVKTPAKAPDAKPAVIPDPVAKPPTPEQSTAPSPQALKPVPPAPPPKPTTSESSLVRYESRPAPQQAAVSASSAAEPKVVVKGRLIAVDINRLRRFAEQPRKEFDPQDLAWLADSIRHAGQLIPALLRRVYDDPGIDYEIIDGERRWISAKMAEKLTLDGIEFPGLSVEDAKKQYEIAVIANFGRSHHTPLELAHAAKQLMDSNGWTAKQVAAMLAMSVGKVQYHLDLLKLVPEAQALMRVNVPSNKRLRIGHVRKLADYPEDFQRSVAVEIQEQGLHAGKTGWYIRKRATELEVRPKRDRPSRPTEDAKNLQRLLDRQADHLDHYLHLPEMPIGEAVRRRGPEERVKLLDTINVMVNKLEELKASIREPVVAGK